MDYPFPLTGKSPEFEADDIDWAMGELLHMIWVAKRAGVRAEKFNPLLFYRCMHVIGRQPLGARLKCIKIIRDAEPGFVRAWFHGSGDTQKRVSVLNHEYPSSAGALVP